MDCGLNLTAAPTRRTTVAFIILSCLGMLFVFRGAIWGDRILAPLDIAATLFNKYKWIDPTLVDRTKSKADTMNARPNDPTRAAIVTLPVSHSVR